MHLNTINWLKIKREITIRKLKFCFTLAIILLLLISCGADGVTEIRIEAENMNLTNYEIGKEKSRTFIKLADSTGIAKINFSLPSGRYDIDVSYLSESAGQNTYAIYIADNQIVAWLGKNKDDQWHKLSEQQWHTPKNIEINKGDEIRVEGLSETGSKVIFDYIKFTTSTRVSTPLEETPKKEISNQSSTNLSLPKEGLATIYPDEYSKAFKNPLKGFRPSNVNHEYGTLMKSYIKWDELENSVGDDVNKIKKFCNEKWRDVEKFNMKVIPRVYLEWPGQKEHWPEDMTPGDFTSDQFKQRVIAMIKKLGKAWDNDSRVAYVEMGIMGEWGEMEWPDTKDEIKEAIAAQFNESFKNKLVMIRWPNTYNDHIYNFGYYWDSFAHQDQRYYAFHLNNTSPRWKTAVIGGETAYNWGNLKVQPGESPEISLKDSVHRDYIVDNIRKLHVNHVGWIANYNQGDEGVRAGAEIVQKALGYRFVIEEVNYPKRIDTDTEFTVSLKVKNTGSSPFYYDWPVEISLLQPSTKKVIWKKQFKDIYISSWMPGDKWDDSTSAYTIPARTYTVNQTLKLNEIKSGRYIIALAILDPSGNRPSARFAIKNYYNGGRHPIGKVGVNRTIDSFSVSGFEDIQSDISLSYDTVVK